MRWGGGRVHSVNEIALDNGFELFILYLEENLQKIHSLNWISDEYLLAEYFLFFRLLFRLSINILWRRNQSNACKQRISHLTFLGCEWFGGNEM